MHSIHAPARQRGAALLIILIILILVTLMGLTTMRSARLQEKMAGGAADKALAFQASELALRDAEQHILRRLTSGSPFAAGCAAGLCLPPDDQNDDPLDIAHYEFIDKLTESIATNGPQATDYVTLIFITRLLERIGDQSVNIAEDAIYYLTAQDIRHGGELPEIR